MTYVIVEPCIGEKNSSCATCVRSRAFTNRKRCTTSTLEAPAAASTLEAPADAQRPVNADCSGERSSTFATAIRFSTRACTSPADEAAHCPDGRHLIHTVGEPEGHCAVGGRCGRCNAVV
jgi:hypothetical protein